MLLDNYVVFTEKVKQKMLSAKKVGLGKIASAVGYFATKTISAKKASIAHASLNCRNSC
jgi:hypothetical protein